MRGAYCLRCREKGPDITFDVPDDMPIPIGLAADIEFECERCGQVSKWSATYEATGWRYLPVTEREES
jgi:hypothetical protein